MPRVSTGPRYYPSKKAWYATLGKDNILLVRGRRNETKEQAQEKYDAEAAARKTEVQGDRSEVWSVLNAYILDLSNRVKNGEAAQNLLKIHTFVLTPFGLRHGRVLVRELREKHVTEFLAVQKQERFNPKLKRTTRWTEGTVTMARNAIHRALNWATEEAGLISRNPLKNRVGKKAKRLKRRPCKSTTAITDQEHALLVEQARRRSSEDFLNLLVFLYRTGARPAEIYGWTASEWEAEHQRFRIKAVPESRGRFKLAHFGEDRLIVVRDDLVPLVLKLVQKYPTGTLFRNEKGKPWEPSGLCSRFRSIKNAANRVAAKRGVPGVRKLVTAYSYRHAFVTRWIDDNLPLTHLCELLNTSEKMVRESYSHLFEHPEKLLKVLNSFGVDTEASPSSQTNVLAV